VNIKFYKRINFFSFIALLRDSFYSLSPISRKQYPKYSGLIRWFFLAISLGIVSLGVLFNQRAAHSAQFINEPVQACVIARDVDLTDAIRAQFANCLGWQADQSSPLCLGSYQPITVTPLTQTDEIRVTADNASIYRDQRSTLSGNVEIQQTQRIVNAQTAYVFRDPKTNQVTKIEFLGNVRYLEPDRLMIARRAVINPQDKSGETEDVLYRFNTDRRKAILPAWGRASLIKRFANQDYLLKKATYTTCSPQDKAWDIQAESISIDNAKATGVARHAKIRINEWPVLYAPYLSFPTNKERKTGFLMPIVGYSNVGGFDFGLPYYLNLAPNYDLTLIPHSYSRRGVMMGAEYRYLTLNSTGLFNGSFLPNDKAFAQFLRDNEEAFPRLQNNSTNRWAVGVLNTTNLAPDLQLHVNLQQVSDDYYLQDFNTNLAIITQRQLLRQADLTYTTDHWTLMGMGQSYQTLHPVNETPISPVYERLPQIMARGYYYELPFDANLSILGQYDQFHWPSDPWDYAATKMPQGPRFHFNPILTVPILKPWGFMTPSVQVVENYYQVQNSWGPYSGEYNRYVDSGLNYSDSLYFQRFPHVQNPEFHFNRTIPRYSLDSGLYFERNYNWRSASYTQTLEPRLFYLKVPYRNQTPIPVYDSGYMIFNIDQLFRTNRFSGFDRIGDANQLSYAVTTRWLSEESGAERANFSIGQIKYFSDRRVELCQRISGYCYDNPYTFGYLSPTFGTSPIATRAVYHVNPVVGISGDYIWDPATRATNNGNLNVHYQPAPNAIITGGYSYLVNGDVTQVRYNNSVNNSLHQAIVAFGWPINEKWSTLGAYSHNISKNYSMMSLFGVQYDSCCWAIRVLGGRTFKSLNAGFEPRYNNNVYLQILLKGLGSVANSDPYNILSTYLPGYSDPFSR